MSVAMSTQTETEQRRAAAVVARRELHAPAATPIKATLSLPPIGVTVSISARALDVAAGAIHEASRLGSESLHLIGDATSTIADAAGSTVNAGVTVALAATALLGGLG